MNKQEAIRLLGGTIGAAAAEVGVTPQAVSGWPDPLPQRIADRVQAALWRMSQREAGSPAIQPARIGQPASTAADCPHHGLAVEGTLCLNTALPMARQTDGSLRCSMCAEPGAQEAAQHAEAKAA